MAMPTWMKKWKEWQESLPKPYEVKNHYRGEKIAYCYNDQIVINGGFLTESQALGLADWIYATLERKRGVR